jgi:hypothetical protein
MRKTIKTLSSRVSRFKPCLLLLLLLDYAVTVLIVHVRGKFVVVFLSPDFIQNNLCAYDLLLWSQQRTVERFRDFCSSGHNVWFSDFVPRAFNLVSHYLLLRSITTWDQAFILVHDPYWFRRKQIVFFPLDRTCICIAVFQRTGWIP